MATRAQHVHGGPAAGMASLPWSTYVFLAPGVLVGATSAFQALVVPTIIGRLRPDTAAAVLGLLSGLSSLAQALAPVAGLASDRLGSRRGVIVAGLLVFGLSAQCMRVGRDSLAVFATGSVALNAGFAALNTLLSSFAIDAAAGDAGLASRSSGVWTAYQIVGAGAANVLVGMYIPGTPVRPCARPFPASPGARLTPTRARRAAQWTGATSSSGSSPSPASRSCSCSPRRPPGASP